MAHKDTLTIEEMDNLSNWEDDEESIDLYELANWEDNFLDDTPTTNSRLPPDDNPPQEPSPNPPPSPSPELPEMPPQV